MTAKRAKYFVLFVFAFYGARELYYYTLLYSCLFATLLQVGCIALNYMVQGGSKNGVKVKVKVSTVHTCICIWLSAELRTTF